MNNSSQWENLIAEDLNAEEQATIAGGDGIQDLLVLESLFGGSNNGGELSNILLLQALQGPNGGGLFDSLFGPATPAD